MWIHLSSLVASDRSGELFTHELQAELETLYPDVEVGGEKCAILYACPHDFVLH